MTPATIRTTVRNLAGLPSTDDLLTDSIIDQFVYDAQLEMVRGALMRGIYPHNLRREASVNLVSGTAEYAVSTDVLAFIRVRAKNASGNWITLTRAMKEDLDDAEPDWQDSNSEYQTGGAPAYFWAAGQEDDTGSSDFGKYLLGVGPTPNYNSTNGLTVRYVCKPVALSTLAAASKSVIYIPEEFHDALCQKAAYRFLSEMTENPRADYQQFLQYFQMSIQTYIATMGEQNQPDAAFRSEPPVARLSLSHWSSY